MYMNRVQYCESSAVHEIREVIRLAWDAKRAQEGEQLNRKLCRLEDVGDELRELAERYRIITGKSLKVQTGTRLLAAKSIARAAMDCRTDWLSTLDMPDAAPDWDGWSSSAEANAWHQMGAC